MKHYLLKASILEKLIKKHSFKNSDNKQYWKSTTSDALDEIKEKSQVIEVKLSKK